MTKNVQIVLHSMPIDHAICMEVVDLVGDNATSLSMMKPAKTNPLFPIYQAALQVEVATYLDMKPPDRIEVVTAVCSGAVIGFALCGLPRDGSSLECEIYYLAVAEPFRKQKVMSLMLRDILARYPGVSLCCGLNLVPLYQHFGFKCIGQRKQNVVMVRGTCGLDIPIIMSKSFMDHPLVVDKQKQAQKKFTQRVIDGATQQMLNQLHKEEQLTKKFLKTQNLPKKTSTVAPVPPIV